MRFIEKSDFLKWLETLTPRPEAARTVEVKIYDGAALVHVLDPQNATTNFETYSEPMLITCLPISK